MCPSPVTAPATRLLAARPRCVPRAREPVALAEFPKASSAHGEGVLATKSPRACMLGAQMQPGSQAAGQPGWLKNLQLAGDQRPIASSMQQRPKPSRMAASTTSIDAHLRPEAASLAAAAAATSASTRPGPTPFSASTSTRSGTSSTSSVDRYTRLYVTAFFLSMNFFFTMPAVADQTCTKRGGSREGSQAGWGPVGGWRRRRWAVVQPGCMLGNSCMAARCQFGR